MTYSIWSSLLKSSTSRKTLAEHWTWIINLSCRLNKPQFVRMPLAAPKQADGMKVVMRPIKCWLKLRSKTSTQLVMGEEYLVWLPFQPSLHHKGQPAKGERSQEHRELDNQHPGEIVWAGGHQRRQQCHLKEDDDESQGGAEVHPLELPKAPRLLVNSRRVPPEDEQ